MKNVDIARAFLNGESARNKNAKTDGKEYILYNTVIAYWGQHGIVFNWGGFHTATTATHINNIITQGDLGERVSYAEARYSNVGKFTV